MKQKLHSLLLMVALLSWSMVVAASDFDDGILKYTITSPSNLEVRCDGFTNAHTNDESVVIPETVNYNNRTYTVTMIGDGDSTYSNGSCSFSSKLKSILLPNSIVTINNYCFSKCYSLTEINIPNSVTAIGGVAFQYCGLTSLVIPESIKKIGNGAFYGNSHLMEVFFLGSEKPEIRSNAFDYCHSALTLYVPNKETYGNASNMVQYVSFPTSTYAYTGMAPKLEWQNNLKGYTATLEDASALDKSVGSHSANVKVRYSNGVDITVEIPYEYTITPAPLSLTVNNATREYGNPNPEFSSVITGFVDGENADNQNMTVNYTCAADRQSNAGNYRILASVNAPNYEVTYHYGTLVVTKAPLTLKVKNTSRLYGDENPQFELIYTGLRNNETSPTWTQAIKVATTATKKSHCGVYPITISGGVSQNYTVSEYTNGELTVSKRPLTVRALDYERSYGEANPTFKIAYDGFVNSDNESCISPKPALSCEATKESNAGTYQILVTGGKAEDYAITYQYGKLIIKPLYLGFKEIYNTVTYNEKGKSVSDLAFEYIPALNMDYDLSDLKLEIWALDGENKYPQHVWTVAGGSYAGNYVNYSGATYAGKYIMTIAGFKTANPNLQVDQKTARAYLTVEKASNELQWADEEPITVAVGETKELGISYGADLYCKFNLVFDESLIQVRAADKETNQSKWYIVGLKEGTTDLSFNISCMKNDWGFYNFDASQTLTRRIQIVPATDINKTTVSSEVQEVARYSLNGQRLTAPTKGVNIVKYSDGSVRKEIVK